MFAKEIGGEREITVESQGWRLVSVLCRTHSSPPDGQQPAPRRPARLPCPAPPSPPQCQEAGPRRWSWTPTEAAACRRLHLTKGCSGRPPARPPVWALDPDEGRGPRRAREPDLQLRQEVQRAVRVLRVGAAVARLPELRVVSGRVFIIGTSSSCQTAFEMVSLSF